MKPIAFAFIFTLIAISASTTRSTSARVTGPSASGTYRFVLEDELTKQIEFDASWDDVAPPLAG